LLNQILENPTWPIQHRISNERDIPEPHFFGGLPRGYPPQLLLKLPDAKQVLGACFEFQNELTAPRTLGKDLGVVVVKSPKFHAEHAGEGIENQWAFAKGQYRAVRLERKKGHDQFMVLVKECLNKVKLRHTHLFARRARSYIQTYYHHH
jgi:hypothetical protein